ncbi:hypothetical protein CAXC1_10002 [Candidatus Xenohaliotis californiensis]|uniref:Uncharacterized protein n=1 Tax=Candidatus Xenohaliotis californiensis TaxID=84677 RepID=A0ABM9N7M0_9RICK|nr:hypothetical protein CAXC1_10002 [Candidatus Xenohaliotis californiensis]
MIILCTSFSEKFFTTSFKLFRLAAVFMPTISGLADKDCPSFINTGPISANAKLNLSPNDLFHIFFE